MNEKLGVVDQQLLKTTNRKQQNTDYVLLLVENSDITLEILNKLSHLNQSDTQIFVMSELFFCEGFSVVHVIITTIIISTRNMCSTILEEPCVQANIQIFVEVVGKLQAICYATDRLKQFSQSGHLCIIMGPWGLLGI